MQEQHCCSQVASAVVGAALQNTLKINCETLQKNIPVHGNSLKSFSIILSNILICNATFRQLPQMTITIIWLFSSVPALVGWLALRGLAGQQKTPLKLRHGLLILSLFLGWLLVNVLLVLFSLPRAISRCRHFDFLSRRRRRLFCRLCTCLRDNKTNNCNG